MVRRALWLSIVSIVLSLTACSAPKNEAADAKKNPPHQSAQSEKPEWYDSNLATCLAGGDGCNFDVLTREDRARALAAADRKNEQSQTAKGQEQPAEGQNP